MKRMTQMLLLGLLLSISSAVLAGQGHDRYGNRGYHGDQRQHDHHHDCWDSHRHSGHHRNVRYARQAPGHIHHGRYCNAWHPRGYVAPLVRYGYGNPGFVIVYQQGAGLYLGGGR